jgi:protein-disulfide isomerase
MSTNSPNLTKAQRREAARAEALALKEKQAARDRRNRIITLSVLGVAIVALAGVVVFILQQGAAKDAATKVENIPLSQVQDVPKTAGEDGGIVIAKDRTAGGKVDSSVPSVAFYFDYMCPICGQFETANASSLEAMIADGKANVVLHPVSILDRQSQGTDYSTRSAAAAAWVADRDPAHFLDFHELLYTNQPRENTTGLTDEQLANFARQAGVPQDVANGIKSGDARATFGQWVFSATNEATSNEALKNPQSGGFGTPTITIDGKRWAGDWSDPANLTTAVADATM